MPNEPFRQIDCELLFVGLFRLRIAFFANLFVFCRFDAAFVFTGFTSLFGFVTAAFRMHRGGAKPGHGANDNQQYFNTLHLILFLVQLPEQALFTFAISNKRELRASLRYGSIQTLILKWKFIV